MDMKITNRQVGDVAIVDFSGRITLGEESAALRQAVHDLLAQGLAHLVGLTKLKGLYLSKTQVSDAGLAHLKGLASLEWLDLEGTQVTDPGLVHLVGLTQLQYVLLKETAITDQGVHALKKALPNLVILH